MKLLGVGHALVDVFVFGDEELPASLGFHLGSYNLVKAERMDSILATLEEPTGFPGGLAANVLRLSASLGVETNFYGVCADDHEGSLFAEGLKAGGVDAHLRTSGKRTGRSITFYTGGRRTIVTSRGISEDISQEDFGSAPIEETDWVFLEGFLMEQPQTFLYLLETAKAKGKKLAFDPGDLKIPSLHPDLVQKLLESSIDLLACNAWEALSLTGQESLEDAVAKLSQKVKIFILKKGEKGCTVYGQGVEKDFPVGGPILPLGPGAGDGFAAGWFYGIAQGWDEEHCGKAANIVASAVLSSQSTVLSDRKRDKILEELKGLA